MLGCMNVHRRGEANAVAVIRISGHRADTTTHDTLAPFCSECHNVETMVLLDLSELEDGDLEAIVRCAKTGGNELAQREAREAQAILDQRHTKETA